jgi:hypothetical protein
VAFTHVTVTHDFDLANQVSALGALHFTPVEEMHNGSSSVPASPIRAPLGPNGLLSQVLAANTDEGTWPVGVRYRVDERITGQLPLRYFITVPHDQGLTVDLYQLIEQAKVSNAGVYPRVPIDMIAYDGVVTPDAGKGSGPFRYTATSNITLGDPINGRDGQDIDLEISVVGLPRTMSFASGGLDPVTIEEAVPYVATLRFTSNAGDWLLLWDNTTGEDEAADHGLLTGLGDDDHTQYHNDTRGDARYSQLAHNHTGTYALISHTHAQADVTGLVADLAAKRNRVLTSSTRTGSYSIVAADVGVAQVYDSASIGTFTLPTNASQSIAVGESIPLRQAGSGQLTVAAAGGVTLQARGSAFKLAGQHAVAEALKTATDTWVLYGDITT